MDQNPLYSSDSDGYSYPMGYSAYENKLDALHRMLENRHSQGKHCYYQVEVDGITVVPCTNYLHDFWNFLPFLSEETHSIDVLVYMGQSYRNTRHHFPVGGKRQDAMSAQEMNQKVEEAVQKWRQEKEQEELKNERDALREKVKKLEEENAVLRKKVEELKNSNFDRDNLLVAQVIRTVVEVYPKIVELVPPLKNFQEALGFTLPEEASTEQGPSTNKKANDGQAK